jgi:hypothetical protein
MVIPVVEGGGECVSALGSLWCWPMSTRVPGLLSPPRLSCAFRGTWLERTARCPTRREHTPCLQGGGRGREAPHRRPLASEAQQKKWGRRRGVGDGRSEKER